MATKPAGLRIFTLAVALVLVRAAGAQDPGTERKTLTIYRAAVAPTIDGGLADWPASAVRATLAVDPDADDFRGNARLLWDDQYLYVAYEVASGKGMRNCGDDPATAFKTGDTVEVFLSVNPDPLASRVPRGGNGDEAKAGDYRVLLTMLRNTKPTVFAFDYVHPGTGREPLAIQVAGPRAVVDVAESLPGAVMVAKDATVGGVPGFVVEAKLPWAYFRGYRPAAGARLLFNLAINFSNASGTLNCAKIYWNGPNCMVTDLGIESQVHPQNWGWLALAEAPGQ